MNEIIANEILKYEIFRNYFNYQNPSFLDEQLVNNVND